MKVLFIATYAGVSGASHSLLGLVKHLKEKGVDPLVIIPSNGELKELLKDNNIPYKKMRMFNWIKPIKQNSNLKEKSKWLIKRLINLLQEVRIYFLIKRYKINIVHINAVTASWGYLASKANKIPVVWHIREFLEEDLNKEFRYRKKAFKYLNGANHVIAISESVSKKYRQFIDNNKLIQIYNGIDAEEYVNIDNKLFEKNNIKLTLAGRIVSTKGHEEVIYAAKYLVENGILNFNIRFVGSEGEEDFITYIQNLIKKFNLESNIEFSGYRKDIHNIWAETDIALVCSTAEAFGRVTVEAMMAGALVIGADTEGTAELISDEYGLTYKQGNSISLAEKIIYAIEHKEEMTKIVSKSREFSRSTFTAWRNAEEIYKVYEDLINV